MSQYAIKIHFVNLCELFTRCFMSLDVSLENSLLTCNAVSVHFRNCSLTFTGGVASHRIDFVAELEETSTVLRISISFWSVNLLSSFLLLLCCHLNAIHLMNRLRVSRNIWVHRLDHRLFYLYYVASLDRIYCFPLVCMRIFTMLGRLSTVE